MALPLFANAGGDPSKSAARNIANDIRSRPNRQNLKMHTHSHMS
jgi:hypothetical protein